MSNRFFSPKTPDYNNTSLFGNTWKDRANEVTELSAQIGSGHKDLSQAADRHVHQKQLLDARFNTFLDVANTPVVTGMAPGLRNAAVLPSFSRARAPSMRSFDENKAASKLRLEFLRCDEPVRANFLGSLQQKIGGAEGRVKGKLEELHTELCQLSPKKYENLGALRTQKQLLEGLNSSASKQKGMDKFGARTKLFFNGTDRKLQSTERKINAIENPSSYELHRAANGGAKVTNRPLYVEELKNRRLENRADEPALRGERDIRNFTKIEFDKLAEAMRGFQTESMKPLHESTLAYEVQLLRNAAKPILYSNERAAVHRFIRDMTRQLKRAGVPAEDLKELNELIPDEPGSMTKLFQGVTPGAGKQMRLQDEAERMAKALPKVLQLTGIYREQLKNNLMQFDLSGVKSLRDTLMGDQSPLTRTAALDFVKSPQGKSFINAMIDAVDQELRKPSPGNPGIPIAEECIKKLKEDKDTRKDPQKTLSALSAIFYARGNARGRVAPLIEDLVQKNQHLFMMTSDTEFWEQEAVDKVGTRLTETDDSKSKSRIFKQIKMRGAALGMDKEEVNAFMVQGIANTLRSRNMTIQGTKVGGMAGALIGNIASTPLSSVAATHAPIFAVPGLMDTILMPVGWGLGLAPGALYGGTVLEHKKQARLKEAKGHQDAVSVSLSGNSVPPGAGATYISASKRLQFNSKTILKRGEVEKSTLTPMHRTGKQQFGKAHAVVWTDMGKDVYSLVRDPTKYALYEGPKQAWMDLVTHHDPKQAARLQQGPRSPAFVNTISNQGPSPSLRAAPTVPYNRAPYNPAGVPTGRPAYAPAAPYNGAPYSRPAYAPATPYNGIPYNPAGMYAPPTHYNGAYNGVSYNPAWGSSGR
jgi:hypothetical protein